MADKKKSYLIGRRENGTLVPSFTAKWSGKHTTLVNLREDFAPSVAETRMLLRHFNEGNLWEMAGGSTADEAWDSTAKRVAGTEEHFHAAVFQLDEPFERM
jgi:hypothetical protein